METKASGDRSTESVQVRIALLILLIVFLGRVGLQMLQVTFEIDGPVPMDAWDSGTMPYGWLLGGQIALALMMLGLIRLVDGRRHLVLGGMLRTLGTIYLLVMLFRAFVGLSGLHANPWFDMPVPTSIHLVMAAFLLIAGHQLSDHGRSKNFMNVRTTLRWVVYPVVLGSALCLYCWLLAAGLQPTFAAYHAVVLGGVAVVVSELLLPYRTAWRPVKRDLAIDAGYLILVQIMLPALAGAAVVFAAARFDLSLVDLWPNHMPIALQVVLMIVLADFGRYWLHRASHAVPFLWRLHAVHHAPEELNALNVSRFHPVEKTIQFALDTAPFILLGVSEQVVGGYLVFYAVNGFFQHSNIDLRLGFLNWIISGPELHRWHHSRDPKLSDHNFGNNLIIWDTVFGTRMLPEGQTVKELGLRNRSFPKDFLGQMLAPLRINPNEQASK